MGINTSFISNKNSKEVINNSPKLPLATDLADGEIAVNFAKDYETLAIKNESGDVVTFSSDNKFYKKSETSGATEIQTALGNKQDTLELVNPSAETKVGLVNSLSQYYDTNIGKGAVIEGDGYDDDGTINNIVASGDYSHAEGNATTASSESSHAEGQESEANGLYSHAEGSGTLANGESSHAEGNLTEANGLYSHAEGDHTTASGETSHAEGNGTEANGYVSHAEGELTEANGYSSHAEGQNTTASGDYSHAEGHRTTANNNSEHASGMYNISRTGSTDDAKTLFTVGNGTSETHHNAFEIRQNGDIYITSGGTDIKLQDNLGVDLSNYYTKSETSGATEIQTALANKQDTLVSGTNIKTINNTSILGSGNITIEGGSGSGGFIQVTNPDTAETKVGLVNSLSQYYDTNIGKGAVIEGEGYSENNKIVASGEYSHAEGNSTTASGNETHAEGLYTKANGNYSHAEGFSTTASGESSHAEGSYTKASGNGSHAEGNSTIASGLCSHAEGSYTIANNNSEHASGMYNISRTSSTESAKTLFTVGNGVFNGPRHNAFEIRKNGDIYIADTSFLKEGNPNYNPSFKYNNVPNICLQDKLDIMLTSSNASAVAISGDYEDLNNRPFGDFIEQLGETIYTFEGTTTQNGPSHYGVSKISIDTSNLSAGDEVKLILDDNVYGVGIVYKTYSSDGGFWINQDPNNGTPFNDTWSVYTNNGSEYFIPIYNLGVGQHKIELVKDGGEQLVTKQIDSKYVDTYTKSEIDATYAKKSDVPQIWTGTQSEYDAITNKDSSTIYFIK